MAAETGRDFAAGGEVAALIRDHDWAATALGPIEGWPPPLRVSVTFLLGASTPMAVYWGADLVLIYNDAWRALIGGKHPLALGRPAREVFPEIWDAIGPMFAGVMAGRGGGEARDRFLPLDRGGRVEDAWFDYSFNPIPLGDGTVGGILNIATETTARVEAERAMHAGKARQAFLLALGDALRDLADPREVMEAAAGLLGRHLSADRAGYAEVDAAGESFTVEREWRAPGMPGLAGRHRLDDFGPALIAEFRAGRAAAFADALAGPLTRGADVAGAYRKADTRAAVTVPLVKDGRFAATLYVHGREPRHWTGEEVALVREVAERTWAAVGRARAEAELRGSEARLRALVHATSHAVYRMSPDWAEMRRLDGRGFLADTHAPSRNWIDEYIHPDDQARVRAAIGDAIARKSAFELEHRVRSAGGGLAWTLSRAVPLLDDAGGVAEWFGAASDVTERRRAEEALREGEERLRLIVENARDYAIFTTDAGGRIETWLPGAARAFGWGAEEAVGRPAAVTFTPEDREAGAPEEEFETARRDGAAPDVRWHMRKDGSRVFIEGSTTALRNPDGSVRGFLKIGQDVTGRRRAEEANARLAAIVASTTDAIVAFAAEDGRILSWNGGAEELFGHAEAEALGGPVGLLVPPDLPEGDPTGVFRRAMDGARVHEHETVRVAKGGERISVSVTASRMLAPDGRAIGVAAIFRDLRQRKAVEERQALLAREVDHRAKNALAVVQTMLRLTRADDVPSFARAVEGRVAALARAQTLLAEERWDGASLHSMLRGELAPFLAGQRADLDGPPAVLPPGAAQPLAMAVHELATNAAKHGALSVPGGRVSVSWRLDGGAAGGALRLRWAEAGGPPVAGPPARRGFGSRVLDGTIRVQLGGTVSLAWAAAGLVCDMDVPLGGHPAASDGAAGAEAAAAD